MGFQKPSRLTRSSAEGVALRLYDCLAQFSQASHQRHHIACHDGLKTGRQRDLEQQMHEHQLRAVPKPDSDITSNKAILNNIPDVVIKPKQGSHVINRWAKVVCNWHSAAKIKVCSHPNTQLSALWMTLILRLKILIPCNPSVSATPAHADKGRRDMSPPNAFMETTWTFCYQKTWNWSKYFCCEGAAPCRASTTARRKTADEKAAASGCVFLNCIWPRRV